MPREDKRPALTWELRNVEGNAVVNKGDVPAAHRLVITASNGGRIDVDLWERVPGEIQIRVHDGQLVIEPEASNTVTIRNKTWLEQARAKENEKRGNRK